MRGRAGVLETAVTNAVDRGSSPKCAKMLHDTIFRTHLDVFCRALPDVPPARKEPVAVHSQLGEGWCGRSPRLEVMACGELRQSRAPTSAR